MSHGDTAGVNYTGKQRLLPTVNALAAHFTFRFWLFRFRSIVVLDFPLPLRFRFLLTFLFLLTESD